MYPSGAEWDEYCELDQRLLDWDFQKSQIKEQRRVQQEFVRDVKNTIAILRTTTDCPESELL